MMQRFARWIWTIDTMDKAGNRSPETSRFALAWGRFINFSVIVALVLVTLGMIR